MISRKLAGFTLLVCSFVLLSGFAFGQDAVSKKDFAEISNQGSSVAWSVNAQYRSLMLTVSAPNGEYFRQEFPAGSSPVFSLNSSTRFGDGLYKYEITLSPQLSPGVEKMMKAARDNGTEEAVAADLRQRGLLPEPMINSGAFRVVSGQIVTANDFAEESEAVPTRTENPKTETNPAPTNRAGDTDVPTENVQVINDDLVVLGSECIGLDCTTSPSFGFDTLRLSENNLRINFQDTSNTASFPTSDWRIVANDTSNGGASYLAIEDTDAGTQPFRVEAGAGSAALWVTDSGGNVGMGTTTPVVELHITDGDTPTVRLEQNGASGFTPQTWDVAGNEANYFIRDVTNGSQLPFQIKPGADTASLFIAANNNVGVGTGTPSQRLEVRGSVLAGNNGSFIVESGSTGGITFADGTVQTTAGGGGGGGGEVNTASNVGAGQGVFKQKIGAQLQFKSLTGGTNVTVAASGADEISIAVPTSGARLGQTIFGGQGFVTPLSNITPVFDYNAFSISTGGQTGFAGTASTIPTNLNLADATLPQIVFKIRYQDTDGVGGAAQVRVDIVAINVSNGSRTSAILFDSNTNAGVAAQTVTVCLPNSGTYLSSGTGTHFDVSITGTATQTATFELMQVYKSTSCP